MNTNTKITASLEDYLEAFYEIMQTKRGIKAVDIAKRLNVKKSSVTEALKNLSSKGLVNYGKYEVISLTTEGEKLAIHVVEKHNLLFDFFSKILDLNYDDATINACRAEHIITENAFNEFKLFLDFCQANDSAIIKQYRVYRKKKLKIK